MTEVFCGPCGALHAHATNESCRVAELSLRRSTRSNKMATGNNRAGAPEKVLREHTDEIPPTTDTRHASVSAEDSEGEERLLLEVRAAERKNRMAALRARRTAALQELDIVKEEDLGRADTTGRGRSHTRRHHRHSRHQRRSSSSSSDSCSRTPTPERRRRSKWSLKKFTVDKKEVKKLNICELIEATCLWAVDQDNLEIKDAKGIFKHISFIAGRASTDKFIDAAHTRYDLAIRKKAVAEGYGAFKLCDSEYSIIHYSLENVKGKTHKSKSHADKSHLHIKDGKRPCYRFNKDSGCEKDEDRCGYGHWCAKCGSRSHKRTKCHRE